MGLRRCGARARCQSAVPERGATGQIHCVGLPRLPGQCFGLPQSGLVAQAVTERGLARSLLGLDAGFVFGLRWDRIVELGIEQQT